jgi:thioredoxin-like negative regulator of GroEL
MLMRTTLTSCLLAALACLGLPSLAAAQEVQWRYEYNSARKEAEAKGLPLVLDFGTDNCFYCRKLDESTFRDPTVVQVMNEKFIPLKINADRDPNLAQMLQVQLYPTLVLAAPDGKILGRMEGYQDATRFYENLQRALASVTNPEWMQRDYQAAARAAEKGDYARAVGLLRTVLEDNKGRPVQAKAAKLLADLEQQAARRLTAARQLHDSGRGFEASETLAALVRDFAGTQTAREASDLLSTLGRNPELVGKQRALRARELLAQAQEDRKLQQFLACLDRCELLVAKYGDLPEATQAVQMAAEIKDNPEWLQAVCESLGDRLSGLYLAQAETWVRRGQPHQAVLCLERLIQRFPGSRQAEVAQTRLTQLRGSVQPVRSAELQRP